MMLAGIALRLAMAGLLCAACVVVFLLVRAAVLRRAGRAGLLPGLFEPGRPGVLFFTTPQCAACRAVQRPALEALKERLAGRVQIIEIDALDHPDLARSWSVLSVPTTFVLDSDGRPVHVNHGVASTGRLLTQLALEP